MALPDAVSPHQQLPMQAATFELSQLVIAELQTVHATTLRIQDEMAAIGRLERFGVAGIVQAVVMRNRVTQKVFILLGREVSGMGRAAVAYKLLSREFADLSVPDHWELIAHWDSFFVLANGQDDQLYTIQHPAHSDRGLSYYDVLESPSKQLLSTWTDTSFFPSEKPVHVDGLVYLDLDPSLPMTSMKILASDCPQRRHVVEDMMESFFRLSLLGKSKVKRALTRGSIPIIYLGRKQKLVSGTIFDEIVVQILSALRDTCAPESRRDHPLVSTGA